MQLEVHRCQHEIENDIVSDNSLSLPIIQLVFAGIDPPRQILHANR